MVLVVSAVKGDVRRKPDPRKMQATEYSKDPHVLDPLFP